MMSNDEKMNIDERRKYLRLVRPRYRKAERKERGQLLDEMVAVTGLGRKALIHLMNGSLERKPCPCLDNEKSTWYTFCR